MKSRHYPPVSGVLSGGRIALISTEWHENYLELCVRRARELLTDAGVTEIHHIVVPGSLELPLAAKLLLERERSRGVPLDAILAFGIIIKGDTDHFEVVRDESARGILTLSLEYSIPILNGIIPAHSMNQVLERCADNDFNKGVEVAHAAIAMMRLAREFRSHPA